MRVLHSGRLRAACLSGLLLLAACSVSTERPSILLVTFDTLRADRLGCYGYPHAETPNLDRLARQWILFEEARSHVPLTLPSHASILTGLLPPHHGVRGNGLFRLPEEAGTLASVLRMDGYHTAAVVSSVVLDRAYGLDRGFETYDDNQRVGERAAFDYLERGASQTAEAAERILTGLEPPFFLWVHLYDPHQPWVAPDPFAERHAGRPYDAEIAFADDAFGRIWLKAEARAGGTLLVAATSDHGESLGDHGENQHGYTLHRGVLRVPLILAGGPLPRGVRRPGTVSLIDVAPTLAELAGSSIPRTDGSSLVAARTTDLGAGKDETWEETLHPLYDSGWAPLRGLLTPQWHFVSAPRPELYERSSDPDDRHDVSSSHPQVVSELEEKLARWGAAMGDIAEPPVTIADSAEAREQRARLSSLGYLSSGAARPPRGGRLDPKDGLPGFVAIERAAELVGAGRAAEARDLVEPHTRKDPQNPRLWHQLGMAQAAAGDIEGAASALRTAVTLDPLSEFIRYSYAEVLAKKGDVAGSGKELERILNLNPRAVDAALQLAAQAVAEGDLVRSEKILADAHAAGARDPDLLERLAHHANRGHEPEKAARYFEEALELRPRDPEALLASGQDALKAGDPLTAINRLSRCVTGPKGFACRIELARAYVVGPRDLVAARRELLAARESATDDTMRREVDRRLGALESMRARGGPASN